MKVKNIFCSIFILFLLSFTVKADEFNRQDISTLTIEHIGRSKHVVFMKITTNSIIIPHGFCTDKQCPKDGSEIEYLGHHDIFKFVPEIYLSRSNFVHPELYNGRSAIKVDICITDGRCHSWNYGEFDDKEMILFYDKLKQIRTGKSEYQFHPKMTSPMPKVIFDKKNLKSINLYQLIAYPFNEVLLYTIKADSITEHPSKICHLINGKLECEVKSKSIQYQDKYNIFKAFPTLFLSGSNFIDLREYDGGDNNFFALFKIEGCFTDGHCNIWDFDIVNRYHNDETKEFLNKIMKFYDDTQKSNTKN